MIISTRRKLGVTLAVLAVVAVAALAWAGVPLLSHTTRVLGSSPNVTVSDEVIRFHWSLVPAGIAFIIGLVLATIPSRENTAIKQI